MLLFGINDRAISVGKALLASGRQVEAFVTHKPSESIRAFCLEGGIELICVDRINSAESKSILATYADAVFLIASFNQILDGEVIGLSRRGVFNCHGGRLPEYRGSSVLNWQMINGEEEIGVSIIKVDEGVDTGPVAHESTFPLTTSMTIGDVVLRANQLFARMAVSFLAEMESGDMRLRKQDPSKAAYWCKRGPEDGLIDWTRQSPAQVDRLVRALTIPYPCAYSYIGGERVEIVSTRFPSVPMHTTPGKVSFTRQGVCVGAAGGAGILIDSIRMAGESQPMPAKALKRLKHRRFVSTDVFDG